MSTRHFPIFAESNGAVERLPHMTKLQNRPPEDRERAVTVMRCAKA